MRVDRCTRNLTRRSKFMKISPAATRTGILPTPKRHEAGSSRNQIVASPPKGKRSLGMASETLLPKRGRPSEYLPEYGEMILDLMAAGLSITAAAGEIGVSRRTVYDWEDKHPDFSHTIKIARAKRTLFLERRLLSATDSPTVTSSIFALKNACPDEWRDKHDPVQDEPMKVTVRIGGIST
jgi:DNA-binding XRE family transcriptional regulator